MGYGNIIMKGFISCISCTTIGFMLNFALIVGVSHIPGSFYLQSKSVEQLVLDCEANLPRLKTCKLVAIEDKND